MGGSYILKPMEANNMLNKNKYIICFILILLLWICGAQEMYTNKESLRNANFIRYIIYFIWLSGTGTIGYLAWVKHPQQWIKQVWTGLYAIAFIILLLLGTADLLLLHFTRSQRNYIQTFRLFFQSPVPFVVLCFFVKLSGSQTQPRYPYPQSI